MMEMTSISWVGGLWGREGVHPGERSYRGDILDFRRITSSQFENIG